MTKHSIEGQSRPRWPWFKDEKIWHGHITVRLSIRVILLVILLSIALLLVSAWFIVGEVQKVNHLAHDNQTSQQTGHAQRLADDAAAEARENAKVAQLACSLVSLIPMGQNDRIDALRVIYDCTPSGGTRVTAPPPTTPTPGPTVKPSSTVPKATSTPQGLGPTATPTATRTTTATTTAPIMVATTTPPLIDLPGTLCSLGRIVNLCSAP